MPQLFCLGEPLIELNAQADGLYRAGFGGDVSNVAIAAARQNATVAICTHVGADRFGDDLLDLWQREGVDCAHVKSISGQDTGLYFVHHDATGHSFTYRRKGSACSRMGASDVSKDAIKAAQMFYSSGISLAVSDSLRHATLEAMSSARAQTVSVAFDPNLRETLWPLEQARVVTHGAMRFCDIALPGLDDARRLTGLQSPEEIIDFYHNLGAKVVALTLGADGAAVSAGDGLHLIAPLPVHAVDATGAGDCFNGVFLANILKDIPVTKAARTANMAAALSTTGFGAVEPIPFPEDINKLKEMTQ